MILFFSGDGGAWKMPQMFNVSTFPYGTSVHFYTVGHKNFSNGRAVVMVVVCPSVFLFVRHICTVAKRCKIWPRLLLIIDRKPHIGFQMKWKLSTLDDLECHWQPVRWAIVATAGLFVFIELIGYALQLHARYFVCRHSGSGCYWSRSGCVLRRSSTRLCRRLLETVCRLNSFIRSRTTAYFSTPVKSVYAADRILVRPTVIVRRDIPKITRQNWLNFCLSVNDVVICSVACGACIKKWNIRFT